MPLSDQGQEDLRFSINLLNDFSVLTREGEYLGTWGTDETDAFYEFTPDGDDQPLCSDRYVGLLCKTIEEWHRGKSGDEQVEG